MGGGVHPNGAQRLEVLEKRLETARSIIRNVLVAAHC